MITPIFAAFAACFLVYLSYRVIKIRKAHSVSVGTAGDPALERAVRNHGNFIEYAPLTLLMLAMVEYVGLAAWAVGRRGRLRHEADLFGGENTRASAIQALLASI